MYALRIPLFWTVFYIFDENNKIVMTTFNMQILEAWNTFTFPKKMLSRSAANQNDQHRFFSHISRMNIDDAT